jgi:hypothetical protein
MLSQFVGPVDVNSAFVLVAISITLCVVVTSTLVKRRSRQMINNDFELAKMKQHDDQTVRMTQIASDRDYKFKQLDQNLITSHERKD